MTKPSTPVVFLLVFFLGLCAATSARAQIYEAVGTRAQGMGGAFVAVADDATATWWNPAGLATGAYLSSVLERGTLDDPGTPGATGPARRDQTTGFALTVPSLGLSYYHFRVGEVRPASAPIAGTPGDRQDLEAAGVDLRAISLHKFGVTIGQSIGNHLVLASTLGVLRGGVGSSTEASGTDAVDRAMDLDVGSETHADIDVGAMVSAGTVRLGASVKHITKPRFGSGDSEMELTRQVRAGIALAGKGSPLIVAADVDLTKTPTVNGDAQHVAAGAELWLSKRRLGLRGGVSANLVGGARTGVSSGVSVALKTGLYLDGALTFGNDSTRSGWGLTARATF